MGVEDIMTTPRFRPALADDLPAIIALLADDPLGQSRERPGLPLDPRYDEAFAAMAADPNQLPLVMTVDGTLAGYLQLTFIPGLSRLGAWRGQIESVRISSGSRGHGLGEALIRHAVDLCRRRGCTMVQLTTDKARADALRFYERLGFRSSHEGMKLDLG
jgi:ribosomal protein S18 acetylase RimI-like enzyme